MSDRDETERGGARRRRLAWALGLNELTPAERRRVLAERARDDARRRRRDQPLGRLVTDVIGQAGVRHALADAQLALHWEEIVGRELAGISRPLELKRRGKGQRGGGKLVVEVARGFAPMVQHMSASLIEKVNGFLGAGAVAEVAIRQGQLSLLPDTPFGAGRQAPSRPRGPAPPLDPALVDQLASFPDGALRGALDRLARTLSAAEGWDRQPREPR